MTRLDRRIVTLASVLGLSLLSCGREVTGPEDGVSIGRSRVASLVLDPQLPIVPGLPNLASEIEPFVSVRVVLQRADGSVLKDTLVAFDANADSVVLALNVALPLATPDSGVTLSLSMAYVNAVGDTVFRGGPLPIRARPVGAPGASAPIVIPVVWSPRGPIPTSVVLSPDTGTVMAGTTTLFTAVARDAQGGVIPNTPIGFSSTDTSRAQLPSLGSGSVTWRARRGLAQVVATLLNGPADTSFFQVLLPASQILLVSGDAQSSLIGTALAAPLVFRVAASDGVGISGVPVTFAITTGGGSLSVATATSDPSGLVSTSWTLGSAVGAQSITVTATGIAGATRIATATGNAPVSAQLAFTATPTSAVAGTTLAPVTVEVRDGSGVITPLFTGPVALALQAGASGATLAGTATVNAVAGVATFADLSISRAATGLILAASSGALTAATSAPFNVIPAAPATLAVVSGDGQSGTLGQLLADSVTVELRDGFANPIGGATIDFAITLGGGAVDPTTAVTGPNGIARTSWTLGATVGAQSLRASLNGTPTIFADLAATGVPGAPVRLELTTGPALVQTAGLFLAPAIIVRAVDAVGATVTGFTGNIDLALANNPTATTPVGTLSVAAVSGVATFSDVSITAVGLGYTLQATSGTLLPVTTGAFNVDAGAPTTLAIIGGAGQSGLVATTLPSPFSVQIVDPFGNAVAAVPVGFAIMSGGGSLSVSAGVTDAAGTLSTSLTLPAVAGVVTVEATSAGLTGSPQTFTANANAGAAVEIVMDSVASGNGQSGVVGTTLPLPLRVRVRDALGNFVGGTTVTWGFDGGSGEFSDTTTVTGAGGLAQTTLILGVTPGTINVTASAVGLTGTPIDFVATALAGPAVSLTVQTEPVSVIAGSPIAGLALTARDAGDNLADTFIGLVAVSIDSGPAGAVLGGTTSVAGIAGGISYGDLTLDLAGTYRLRFTAAGLVDAVTADFGVSAAAPASITAIAGDGQIGPAAQALPTPLGALIEDAFGNPIIGATVTWSVVTGGGTLVPATSLTDATGVAQTTWNLGGLVGAQSAVADAFALPSATFNATATPSLTAVVWSAGAGTNIWTNPLNWVGGAVPIATDSVVIPDGTPFSPSIPTGAVLRALVSEQLSSTIFIEGALTITGTVVVPLVSGLVCDGGTLEFDNAAGSMSAAGRIVCATTVLSGTVTVSDSLHIDSSDLVIEGTGIFDPGASSVRIDGGLITLVGGRLRMVDDSAHVVVGGLASFGGGSTVGLLSAGRLEVGLNFTSGAPGTFAASGTHLTVLDDPFLVGGNVIVFGDTITSGFADLLIQGGDRVLNTTVRVSGSVTLAPGIGLTSAGGGLRVAGDLVGPATSGIGALPSLTLGGALSFSGAYGVTTTIFDGAGQLIPALAGPYTNVQVLGTASMLTADATLTVSGTLTVADGGSLRIGDAINNTTVLVGGDFSTQGGGVLQMQDAASQLIVNGNATFAGGATTGLLTAGSIAFSGDFAQGGGSTAAFQADPGHRSQFFSSAPQAISFADPGAGVGASRFGDVEFSHGSGGSLAIGSDMFAAGAVSTGDAPPQLLSAVLPRLLRSNGAQVSQFSLTNIRWELRDGSPLTGLQGVSFSGMDPAVTQLDIERIEGTPSIDSPVFNSAPIGGGRYLRVADADAGGAATFSVTVTNPLPTGHGGFVDVVAPALLVGWDPTPTVQWSGAIDQTWETAGNWLAGVVPGIADAVVIPFDASVVPILSSTTTIQSLTNSSPSIALQIATGTLTVTEGLQTGFAIPGVSCAPLTAIIVAPVTAVDLQGSVGCDITVAGTSVTGVVDSLRVQGSLTITGAGALDVNGGVLHVSDTLRTTAGGTLTMTSAADTVDVAGTTVFEGGFTTGLLTAGLLRVGGGFRTGPGAAYAPSLTHVTEMYDSCGECSYNIILADTLSHFVTLRLLQGSRTVALASSAVHIVGDLVVDGLLQLAGDSLIRVGNDVTGVAGSTLAATRLSVAGAFDFGGIYLVDTLILAGVSQALDARNVFGTLVPYANVRVTGTVTATVLPADVLSLTGDLVIDGGEFRVGSLLDTDSIRVVLGQELRVENGGRLTMDNAFGRLDVGGAAFFAGGSTSGYLSAGSLVLNGSFTQSGDPASFAASGTHVTRIATFGIAAVTFANPGTGAGSSHFQVLELAQGLSSGVQLMSDAVALGQVRESMPGLASISALAQRTLTTAGASVSNIGFDQVRWVVTAGEAVDQMQLVQFNVMDPTVAQLEIVRPAGSIVLDAMSFATVPTPATAGRYLRVEDSATGDSDTLVVTLVSPTPALNGGFAETVGGARIAGWPITPPPPNIQWNGSASTLWSNPANWSLARLPQPGDSVVIDLPGFYTVDIDVSASVLHLIVGTLGTPTINHSAGTILDIDSLAVFGGTSTLNLTGGSVMQGAGFILIGGDLNWNGGSFAAISVLDYGDAVTMIAPGGVANIATTGVATLSDRTLAVGGTANVGGSGLIDSGPYSQIVVLSGGTLEFQTPTSIGLSGGGQIVNSGTVRKSAAAGTVNLDWPLTSTGSVDVEAGVLDLRNEFVSLGADTVRTGATLHSRGHTELYGALTVLDGGMLQFNSGGYAGTDGEHFVNFGSTLSGSGTFRVEGANLVDVQGSFDMDSTVLLNAVLDFNGADTSFTNHGSYLGGGSLRGAGTLAMRTTFTQTGGNTEGTGTLAVLPGAVATFDGPIRGWTLDVAGTLIWGEWDLSLEAYLGSNARMNILAGGLLDIQHGTVLRRIFANALNPMSNAGTIRKSTGSGVTQIGSPLTHTGLLDVLSGSIDFQFGCTVVGGTKTGPGTVTGTGCTFP